MSAQSNSKTSYRMQFMPRKTFNSATDPSQTFIMDSMADSMGRTTRDAATRTSEASEEHKATRPLGNDVV